MRVSFLSLAALALTAFAVPTAPVINTNQLTELRSPNAVRSEAGNTFTTPIKHDVKSNKELIVALQDGLTYVKSTTSSINGTLARVIDSSLNKEEAITITQARLIDLQSPLLNLLAEIFNAVGIDPSNNTDFDQILLLVIELVNEIFCSVKYLVAVVGLRPTTITILHALFGLVASILYAVIGLVGKILPGLIHALTPIVTIRGRSILAHLTRVVAGVLLDVTLAVDGDGH